LEAQVDELRMREDPIGIVLPLLREHADRILDQNRDVLVKYTSRIPKKPRNFRLKEGMKVLFYLSGSNRTIAGEAEIGGIRFMVPHDVLTEYGARLFLSREELSQYTRLQPTRSTNKPPLVLEVRRARRFTKAVAYRKRVSTAGEYLTAKDYALLANRL
jgi:hypothetical protein